MCHYANVLCQHDSYYTSDRTISCYWLCALNLQDFELRDAEKNAFRNALFRYDPSGILIVVSINYHEKSIISNLMMKELSKYFDPLNVIYFLLTIFHPKIVFRDVKMTFKVVIGNNSSHPIKLFVLFRCRRFYKINPAAVWCLKHHFIKFLVCKICAITPKNSYLSKHMLLLRMFANNSCLFNVFTGIKIQPQDDSSPSTEEVTLCSIDWNFYSCRDILH